MSHLHSKHKTMHHHVFVKIGMGRAGAIMHLRSERDILRQCGHICQKSPVVGSFFTTTVGSFIQTKVAIQCRAA